MKGKKDTIGFVKKNIILLIVVLAGILLLAFSAYYTKLGTASEQRAYRLLSDSAEAQRVAIDERVSASFQQMSIIGAEIDWKEDIYSDPALVSRLDDVVDASPFENLAVSDTSGVMLYRNGDTADCSDREYFKKAIEGEESIEFLKKGRMSGKTIFVFAQPVYRNREIVGVVVATRSLSDMSETLATHDSIENQYKFLCYEDGEIITAVIGEGEKSEISSGYLKDCFKPSGNAQEISENKVSIYEYNGQKYYGIYAPSGLDDIYIFSAAETDYANNLAGLYNRWTIAIIALALALTIIASFIIIRQLKMDITLAQRQEAEKKHKLEEYYNFQNRRYLGRKNVSRSFYLNLTRNTCRKDSDGKLGSEIEIKDGMSIELLCNSICGLLHPQERARYMESMSRESLIEAFGSGESTVRDYFLFYYSGYGYTWLRTTADIVRNPMTGELEAILYAFSVNRKKRVEQIGQKLINEKFVAMGLIDVMSGYVYGIKGLSEYNAGETEAGRVEEILYDTAAAETLGRVLPTEEFQYISKKVKFETVLDELEKNGEYSVRVSITHNGESVAEHYQISYSYLDDYQESIMVSCENVTDILEGKLDTETGLYNMAGFDEAVQKWIADNPGRKYRLQRYRIDGFMNINATYGYKVGSRLINDIGKYMRARTGRDSFAAHINADNFVRFCADDSISPESFYEKFLTDFADYELSYPLFLKMGIYDLCEPDCDTLTMSYRANLAIQSIEGDFSRHIAYYSKGLMQATKEEQQMLADVENAVRQGQFEVWLQPQYDYSSGRIIGAEALARWNHPELGMITPGAFIPVLERSRQVGMLDEYVWDKACQYINRWSKKGFNIPVSVNVFRVDIQNLGMCETLINLVKKYDIPPEYLRLEITESAYMNEPHELAAAVAELRAAGFIIEMDDFGSGYSSLNALKDLDIDVLKLDMKLVSEIGDGNEKNDNILRNVVHMANALNMSVIAEGVETEVQAGYLKSINCNYMQGYYFSKPIKAEDIEKLFEESKNSN